MANVVKLHPEEIVSLKLRFEGIAETLNLGDIVVFVKEEDVRVELVGPGNPFIILENRKLGFIVPMFFDHSNCDTFETVRLSNTYSWISECRIDEQSAVMLTAYIGRRSTRSFNVEFYTGDDLYEDMVTFVNTLRWLHESDFYKSQNIHHCYHRDEAMPLLDKNKPIDTKGVLLKQKAKRDKFKHATTLNDKTIVIPKHWVMELRLMLVQDINLDDIDIHYIGGPSKQKPVLENNLCIPDWHDLKVFETAADINLTDADNNHDFIILESGCVGFAFLNGAGVISYVVGDGDIDTVLCDISVGRLKCFLELYKYMNGANGAENNPFHLDPDLLRKLQLRTVGLPNCDIGELYLYDTYCQVDVFWDINSISYTTKSIPDVFITMCDMVVWERKGLFSAHCTTTSRIVTVNTLEQIKSYATTAGKSLDPESQSKLYGCIYSIAVCSEPRHYVLSEEVLDELKLQVLDPQYIHSVGGSVKVYPNLGDVTEAELHKPFISLDSCSVNVALTDEENSELKEVMGDRVVVYPLDKGSFTSSPDWVLDEESKLRLNEYLARPDVKLV